MKEGLIGVIVPVYKVEKYIAECIESILAQTYTNFRLILVDDGTPDNAGKICDEYAKKDPRITVIHQENTGVTRARARGVEEAANCEWITFVDGDDTITTDALEVLLSAIDIDTDIIISQPIGFEYPSETQITLTDYIHCLISGHQLSSAPWGKIFRKVLFTEKTFEIPREIINGEDLIMNIKLGLQTQQNVKILHRAIYNYNLNENSTTISFKHSLEHETLFHKELLSALSKDHENKYTHSHITRRLIIWNSLFGYSYKKPQWFGTAYHKLLIQDIKKYNYKGNVIEMSLLKHKNPILRFFVINIKKLKNLIL